MWRRSISCCWLLRWASGTLDGDIQVYLWKGLCYCAQVWFKACRIQQSSMLSKTILEDFDPHWQTNIMLQICQFHIQVHCIPKQLYWLEIWKLNWTFFVIHHKIELNFRWLGLISPCSSFSVWSKPYKRFHVYHENKETELTSTLCKKGN